MDLTFNQLFKCNAYLGENRRSWNANMNLFLVGYSYDIYFINLKYTLFLFRKVLNVLSKNSETSTLILLPNQMTKILYSNKNITSFFNHKVWNINVLNKWVNGTLSNFVRFKNEIKVFPKILFLFSNLSANNQYLSILNEIRKYDIVSMGFISTSDNPYILDYFIPINNNSIELIKFYYRLILFFVFLCNYKVKLNFTKRLVKRLKIKKNFNKI